jgi:hypothetical protein
LQYYPFINTAVITMTTPFYIENGQVMSYVPIEVKTHRDAYAATLHVLFKHVADFHMCVAKTFSKTYGIPEDDIIRTIQESDEFKNMNVDRALHSATHDAIIKSLGYNSETVTVAVTEPVTVAATEPVTVAATEPVTVAATVTEPGPKKRIVKKKQNTEPAPADPLIPAPAEIVAKKRVPKKNQLSANETITREQETESACKIPVPIQASVQNDTVTEKKKVIKKTTPKILTVAPAAPLVAAPLVAAPLVAAPLVQEQAQSPDAPLIQEQAQSPDAPIVAAPTQECVKIKIIKKLKAST